MDSVPLQKWLQRMGVGSKRAVRELIRSGRVRVDGRPVSRYAEPVGLQSAVEVDGVPLSEAAPRTVLLMNKPVKHPTAIADSEHGPGLGRYLPAGVPPVFPVGRLDFNTEGALLWTNDGALARRILHPAWSLPKRYGVKIRGHLQSDDAGLVRMRFGMNVQGETYRPVAAEVLAYRARATWVDLTLTEGKHRQIRRMCAAVGYQLVKLRRLAIGPVELGDLRPRCVRHLSPVELLALQDALDLSPA